MLIVSFYCFQIEKNIVYVQLVDFIQVVLAYQCSSFVFNQRASDCFDSYFPSVIVPLSTFLYELYILFLHRCSRNDFLSSFCTHLCMVMVL